jgi:homoserine dehydrogenase
LRIIIVGFGVVGHAFARILNEKKADLLTTFGFHPTVVAITDIDGAIINPSGIHYEKVSQSKQAYGSISHHPDFQPGINSLEVINNVDAEVVVEATPTNIPDGEPGLSHIMAALKKKFHVITTNKGPLALALPALLELAEYNEVLLRFSGTVGGGTPILDIGRKCLTGDQIHRIDGILNGTTNYVLTRMAESEMEMPQALAEAQNKGFAETNPSYDVEGIDSACKLAIMSNWLMNRRVTIKDVEYCGISKISVNEIRIAKQRGNVIKLVATVNDEKLVVKPQTIPLNHTLNVAGTLNAVVFKTEYAGEVTIIGKGAGGRETGGAVLRDLIDIRKEFNVF